MFSEKIASLEGSRISFFPKVYDVLSTNLFLMSPFEEMRFLSLKGDTFSYFSVLIKLSHYNTKVLFHEVLNLVTHRFPGGVDLFIGQWYRPARDSLTRHHVPGRGHPLLAQIQTHEGAFLENH